MRGDDGCDLSVLQGEALPQGQRHVDLAAMLRLTAQACGEKGVRFIGSGEHEEWVSYGELYQNALRVGSGLLTCGIRPAEPVLIAIRHPMQFISALWGCLLAAVIPLPCRYPERPDSGDMLRLAAAAGLLEGSRIITAARDFGAQSALAADPNLARRIVPLESLQDSTIRQMPNVAMDAIALLLMTSGSSGSPKLVTQTHRALAAFFAASCAHNDLRSTDVSLNWLPLEHVAGLVMSHLRDVWLGCEQIQALTGSVLERPARWIEWLHRYRVSVTWAPNFAFELVARSHRELPKARWDLTCVRKIFNGAEKIVLDHAQGFMDLLVSHGLSPRAMCPVWGMSETCSAVVYATAAAGLETLMEDRHVAVGRPMPGISIRVVDEMQRLCREGVSGSLEVKGDTVTAGYYRNETANAALFTSDGWLRTGDTAIVSKGRLFITGRSKDTIIINGISYGSEEFEAVAAGVSGVRPTYVAAVALRPPGSASEVLALWFVAEPAADAPGVAEKIRQALSARFPGLTPVIIACAEGDIPKTAVGKIRRAEIRDTTQKRFAEGLMADRGKRHAPVANEPAALAVVCPPDAVAAAIKEVWAEILELDAIADEDNFFELGGNSLILSMMLAAVSARVGCELKAADLPGNATVQGLASLISTRIHGQNGTMEQLR